MGFDKDLIEGLDIDKEKSTFIHTCTKRAIQVFHLPWEYICLSWVWACRDACRPGTSQLEWPIYLINIIYRNDETPNMLPRKNVLPNPATLVFVASNKLPVKINRTMHTAGIKYKNDLKQGSPSCGRSLPKYINLLSSSSNFFGSECNIRPYIFQ